MYKLGISNISHTNCQPSKRGFYHMIQCSHMQKRKITSWLDYRSLCFSSCYSKILDLNKRACVFCFLLFWFGFEYPGLFYCVNLAVKWKSCVWSLNLLPWKWRVFQKFLLSAFVDWFRREKRWERNIFDEAGGRGGCQNCYIGVTILYA